MKPVSIMIVENNPNLRQILRHAFEDRGYLTWTCPAPEIAKSIFGAIHPSIVILDLDMDDPAFLHLIEDWKELSPETRVILVEKNIPANDMADAMLRKAAA